MGINARSGCGKQPAVSPSRGVAQAPGLKTVSRRASTGRFRQVTVFGLGPITHDRYGKKYATIGNVKYEKKSPMI